MPRDVPWSFVEKFRVQAELNHDQTLERLAERGGLAPEEMWLAAHGQRVCREHVDEQVAIDWLYESLKKENNVKTKTVQRGKFHDNPYVLESRFEGACDGVCEIYIKRGSQREFVGTVRIVGETGEVRVTTESRSHYLTTSDIDMAVEFLRECRGVTTLSHSDSKSEDRVIPPHDPEVTPEWRELKRLRVLCEEKQRQCERAFELADELKRLLETSPT